MPGEHKNLPFNELHKAKFETGLDEDKPSAPEGAGDVYWASDTQTLYIASTAGTDWLVFNLDDPSVSLELGELTDVEIDEPSEGQFIKYDGEKWVNDDPEINLDDLFDVFQQASVKGAILVFNGSGTWMDVWPSGDEQIPVSSSSSLVGVEWKSAAELGVSSLFVETLVWLGW